MGLGHISEPTGELPGESAFPWQGPLESLLPARCAGGRTVPPQKDVHIPEAAGVPADPIKSRLKGSNHDHEEIKNKVTTGKGPSYEHFKTLKGLLNDMGNKKRNFRISKTP